MDTRVFRLFHSGDSETITMDPPATIVRLLGTFRNKYDSFLLPGNPPRLPACGNVIIESGFREWTLKRVSITRVRFLRYPRRRIIGSVFENLPCTHYISHKIIDLFAAVDRIIYYYEIVEFKFLISSNDYE